MAVPRGAGFHGKLPARGDFLTANLPSSFLDPWDAWLQAGIAASRQQLGEQWLPSYLDSPIWRFVLSPGACGPLPWIGVLMPSVDKVGRYFPLTIADALPDGASAIGTVTAATTWFERAEALAMRALEDDRLDLEAFGKDVATLAEAAPAAGPAAPPAAAVGCVELDASGSVGTGLSILFDRFLVERLQTYSIWWNSGSSRIPGHACLTPFLPPAERFVHFLAGATAERPQAP